MTLYEKVTQLRENLGLSQSEFERKAGLSKGTVTNWKKRKPNMNSLEKAAAALNCDVRYFLSENVGQSNETTDYENDIIAEISQNPDLKLLLEIGRKAPPDRLRTYVEFLNKITEEGSESEKDGK